MIKPESRVMVPFGRADWWEATVTAVLPDGTPGGTIAAVMLGFPDFRQYEAADCIEIVADVPGVESAARLQAIKGALAMASATGSIGARYSVDMIDGRTVVATYDRAAHTVAVSVADPEPEPERIPFMASESRLSSTMASGHRARTGHDLAGFWTSQDDIWSLTRTCCPKG